MLLSVLCCCLCILLLFHVSFGMCLNILSLSFSLCLLHLSVSCIINTSEGPSTQEWDEDIAIFVDWGSSLHRSYTPHRVRVGQRYIGRCMDNGRGSIAAYGGVLLLESLHKNQPIITLNRFYLVRGAARAAADLTSFSSTARSRSMACLALTLLPCSVSSCSRSNSEAFLACWVVNRMCERNV